MKHTTYAGQQIRRTTGRVDLNQWPRINRVLLVLGVLAQVAQWWTR